jgi:hypothetical protein
MSDQREYHETLEGVEDLVVSESIVADKRSQHCLASEQVHEFRYLFLSRIANPETNVDCKLFCKVAAQNLPKSVSLFMELELVYTYRNSLA